MKIKTKLWGITAIIGLMLIVMISVVYLKGRSTIVRLASTEGSATTQRTSLWLNSYFESISGIVNTLAPSAPGLFNPDGTPNKSKMLPALTSILKNNTQINPLDLYIGDAKTGAFISAAGFTPGGDYDPRKRPWYIAALESDATVFSPPYQDVNTKKIVIAASRAIRSQDHSVLGVIGLEVSLEDLATIVPETEVFNAGYGALLDSTGRVLMHKDPSLALKANMLERSEFISDTMLEAGRKIFSSSTSKGQVGAVDYVGDSRVSRRAFYIHLNNGYVFLMTFPTEDLNAIVNEISWPQLVGGILTTLAILIGMFFTIPSITRPISGVAKALSRLASLNLTPDPSLHWIEKQKQEKTEIGGMVASLVNLRNEIGNAMGNLKQSVDSTTSTAKNLEELTHQSNDEAEKSKQAVHFVTNIVTSSLDSINHANRSVEEVSHAANMTATSATEGAQASSATATISQNAVNGVQQFIGKLSTVEKASLDNSRSISEVGASVVAISEFVNTIRNIASQTNLLALNAAIEAARAGEAGRGFAVVADEVRKLAEESNVASHQVAELIEKLQHNTNASITATQQSTQVVSEVIVDADETLRELRGALDAIGRINDSMQTIAAAAQEQAASSTEISHSINQVTESTQDLAEKITQVGQTTDRSVETMFEVSNQAKQLAHVSEELQQIMDRFILDESTPHSSHRPMLGS